MNSSIVDVNANVLLLNLFHITIISCVAMSSFLTFLLLTDFKVEDDVKCFQAFDSQSSLFIELCMTYKLSL